MLPLMLAFSWSGFWMFIGMAAFLLIGVLMMLVVLIQKPQGGGLAGAFGSGAGSGQTAFGTKTGDALTVATIGFFVIWLVVAVGLNFAMKAPGPTPAAATSTDNSSSDSSKTPADQGKPTGTSTTNAPAGSAPSPGAPAPTPAPAPAGSTPPAPATGTPPAPEPAPAQPSSTPPAPAGPGSAPKP